MLVDMTSAIQQFRYQFDSPMVALFFLGILRSMDVVLAFVVCAVAICVIYDRYFDGRYTALQLHCLVGIFGLYGVSGAYTFITALVA